MKIICCFYETGNRKPNFPKCDFFEMRDVASMQESGYNLNSIFKNANIALVHSTENNASVVWSNIATNTPVNCIAVEYTDRGGYILDKIIQGDRQVFQVPHRAIETNMKRFLEHWAESRSPDMSILLTDSNRQLSICIHQLENLILPLRLDVETLSEQNEVNNVTRAVGNDYFGKCEKGEPGYLLSNRRFQDGRKGIENEIAGILDSIRGVPRICDGNVCKGLVSGQGFAPAMITAFLGIQDARDKAALLAGQAQELAVILSVVRDKIVSLASELRELRDRLEVEEEGGKS